MNDADIYVAINGNDNWSGGYPAPLADGSDGPVLTLDGARLKARDIEKDHIKIYIREGNYFLKETVVFTRDDSNELGKTTYEAYPEETPVFTSGVCLNEWKICGASPDNLPEVARGHIFCHKIPQGMDTVLTLFDGREQLVRTHGDFFMPAINHDYERVDSLNVAKEEDRHLLKRVDFAGGQIKNWSNIKDVELRFMPVPWTMNLLPLESVDINEHIAWLQGEATAPLCAKSKGIRVENVIDYLDAPGKWCVNTDEGNIYYWPRSGVPSNTIYVPSLKNYIHVEGQIDYDGQTDQPVRNLEFVGLTFTYGKVDRTDVDYKGSGIQHDWEMFDKRTALFSFRGAMECRISDCHFHTSSGGAIRLDLFCQKIIIENNLIDQIGAMGVLLCGYGPGTKNVNKNNIIRNNVISRCGEEIWHGHAVFLWQSGENLIEHNRIHDTARKAIGLCGVRVTILRNPNHKFDEAVKTIRWDEINATLDLSLAEDKRYLPYLHTKDNQVNNNEIYKALEKIGDGSALNISGAGEGNHINNNYLHHISTNDASGVMRVDDWQSGTVFEGNIIYKSNISGVIRKNYNHILNNYFIDCNCAKGYIKFASFPDEKAAYGSKIQKNIFYESGEQAEFFGSGYLVSDEATLPINCQIEKNLYYIKGGDHHGQKHLDTYTPLGLEKGSVSEDPLFNDISDGDFRLRDASPAKEMGIEQIDFRTIGINKDYPEKLLKQVYVVEDLAIYHRGTDATKTSYEWW